MIKGPVSTFQSCFSLAAFPCSCPWTNQHLGILSSKDVAGRGDFLSWALLREAEAEVGVEAEVQQQFQFLRWGRVVSLLGEMVQFHYSWVFLQFLTCSTKLISKHIPKNDSARESVTAAAMAALTRRMNSLSEKRLPFFLPAELPEMFKHPARVRQDPPLKWQEKSELPAHPCLLCGVCECSFRMESLQCCSGPWLPEKWVLGPTALPVQVLAVGKHKTNPSESWAGFNHLMSSGCRMALCSWIFLGKCKRISGNRWYPLLIF